MLPADDRNAVGMVHEERGPGHLGKLGTGLVVDPAAPLLQDHVALRQDDLVGQDQVGHAIRLVLHHEFEAVTGDGLEVAGEVVAGEGILAAAVAGDQVGELAGLGGLGALEQQVLEEMRQARLAPLLVSGPDPVPDHVVHDRRAPVGHHDHLKAVVEGEAFGFEDAGLDGPGKSEQERGQASQDAEPPERGKACHDTSGRAIRPAPTQAAHRRDISVSRSPRNSRTSLAAEACAKVNAGQRPRNENGSGQNGPSRETCSVSPGARPGHAISRRRLPGGRVDAA